MAHKDIINTVFGHQKAAREQLDAENCTDVMESVLEYQRTQTATQLPEPSFKSTAFLECANKKGQ